VEKAESGSSQAELARKSMETSLDAVTRVTTLVLDIANASKEQSEGIDEMNEAIVQIDQTTQQNAALVEEAAAATELLQEDAERLVQLTTVFHTASKTDAAAQQHQTSASQPKALRGVEHQRLATAHRPKEMLQASEVSADDWREF
jgi:methyl-accepting chemotaxis protein